MLAVAERIRCGGGSEPNSSISLLERFGFGPVSISLLIYCESVVAGLSGGVSTDSDADTSC